MKFKVALILHSLQLFEYDFVFLQQQDNSHYIENEELNGFLKDLMDLVEEVRNGFVIAVKGESVSNIQSPAITYHISWTNFITDVWIT